MYWPRAIRFRYTLRTLIVVVTLIGVWGGYHTYRGWRERQAAEVLLRVNAKLQRDLAEHGRGPVTIGDFYRKLVYCLWREQFVGGVDTRSQAPAGSRLGTHCCEAPASRAVARAAG